ncbi:CaiB/BaiF CoA transferase family protein [Burkholderia singularis]|uniref:Alpha-methylacyl-CoA racemase n=1 Tax=Burkholderia singularis TaxID=1503053 RepID=A0A238HAM1_9BURK|nr:CaiB/BaiF CoA-transferase family protein [Burkholderia singularis]SMG02083.1 Alpha-methylacyl-CoA racemase [Burkholderia singularis]
MSTPPNADSHPTMETCPANPLLRGVRVLDLSRLLPGPFCSLYLAQLGADVIKIEAPGGDYARASAELFEQVNRGKRSITLDLRQSDDVARFKALVAEADVVLESFRPGVMDKLGCGYDTLKRINPRLVYAALTGYGQTGPYRDRAGHDVNYLAIAGVLDQIGAHGGPPAMSNLQIADLAGGSLTCAIGILAALFGARASGVGSFVDVGMADGSAALQVMALAALRQHGAALPRGCDVFTGALPNYAIYRCRDGRHLAIGALEPKFFRALLTGIAPALPGWVNRVVARKLAPRPAGAPGAAPDDPQAAARAKLQPFGKTTTDPRDARRMLAPLRWLLTLLFLTRPRDAWVELLEAADACVTPVLTLGEALDNAQLRARGMVLDDGGKPAFNLPIFFDNACATHGPSPALGADNDGVLGALAQTMR